MKVRTRKKTLGYFNYIIALTFLLMFLSLGCSKEENPAVPGGGGGGGTNALIGTWNATSVTLNGGQNLISNENTVKYTFTATNYTYNNTGQFCPEGSETCTETGTVTVTATSITVTWSDGSTETTNYTLSGNTLTITYEDDGTYTFIMQKQ